MVSGGLKAELRRLLTHSSSMEIWLEECGIFYEHLRRRGYPTKMLYRAFNQVSWNNRKGILEHKEKHAKINNERFFENYRGCVLSMANAPGMAVFKKGLDLSLLDLNDCFGMDIFPTRAFFSVKSAPRLANLLQR